MDSFTDRESKSPDLELFFKNRLMACCLSLIAFVFLSFPGYSYSTNSTSMLFTDDYSREIGADLNTLRLLNVDANIYLEYVKNTSKDLSDKSNQQVSTLSSADIVKNLFEPWVSTNKPDYVPGEYVTVRGGGFSPGETVSLLFEEDQNFHAPYTYYAVADSYGEFINDEYLIEQHDLGVTFTLTATGQSSGITANTTFTDNGTQPAADLDQIRNGAFDAPVDTAAWVNGNAGAENAHFAEGMSIAYRVKMINMPAGETVTLTLGYDVIESGTYAIDYLTDYDRLEPHLLAFLHDREEIDPTKDFVEFDLWPLDEVPDDLHPIPMPPGSNLDPLVAIQQNSFNIVSGAGAANMAIWNGDITNITYPNQANLNGPTSEQQISITFTVGNNPSENVVISFGGHIASRLDWGYDENGVPKSAGGINGSPYHMRLKDWTLNNLGNQDRSLKAAAVVPPPECDLDGPASVCEGSTNVYTVTPIGAINPTYVWELIDNTSNASFDPTPGVNDDMATVNAGTSGGSYTVKVTINSEFGSTICTYPVTVIATPDVQTTNLEDCEVGTSGLATFNLNNGVTDDGGGTVTFHASLTDAQAGTPTLTTPETYNVNIGQETIWVRSETAEGCYGTGSFTIDVYDNPDLTVQNLESCEEGTSGAASFDLNGAVTDADGGTISFYANETDANNAANAVTTPYSANIGTTTLWARSDNDADSDEGCYSIASFTIDVYDNPDLTVQNLESCEEGTSGAASFDLNGAVTDADGGTISFYANETDANNAANAVTTPYSANIGTTTLWARSDNDADSDEGCYSIASFTIDVYDNPDLTVQNLESCEEGTSGAASFDLNGAVTDADGGTISFYANETDANNAANAVSTPYSANIGTTTLWARSDNDADSDEGCYSIASFTIDVYDNPDLTVQNLESCEEGTSGAASFNLNGSVTDADGGTISFYANETDANNAANAVTTPYSANIGTTTLWARSDNDADSDEGCYSIASFTIDVYDNPDLTVQNLESCEEGTSGAASFDLNGAVTDADGGTISFYANETDANNAANAVTTPYSANIGTTTLWARSDNDADSDEGCYSIASFTIDVYDNPDLTVQNLESCEEGTSGAASFDLNGAVTDADGGTISFYANETDANNAANAVSTPYSANIGTTTLWARSDNDADSDEGCYSIASFTIDVYDNPDLTVQNLESCEEGTSGAASFDLNGAVTDADGGTISFYANETDANNAANAVSTPYSANIGTTTLWARSDNDADSDEGCYSIASFTIDVYDNPDLTVQNLESCEEGTSGAASFDLNGAVTDADGGTISFYANETDANNAANAVSTPYSANIGTTTLWARSDNDADSDEGCYSIASFTIDVYDNPDLTVQNLESCEEGTSGAASFNLNGSVTDADGGTISFYANETDANNAANAVTTPYSANIGTTTLWARSDNDADSDEGCYSIASFTIDVYDNPDLTVQNLESCEEGTSGAASFDLNGAVTDADGGTISFYANETDANNAANAVTTPYSANIGTTTLWARSDNDADSDEGCYSIASFTIDVYDNPDLTVQNLESCEEGTSGAASFDLNGAVTDADGGTISFYANETDANNAANAVSTPYSANIGTTTLWARSDNDSDSDEGCYSIASFTIDVYDNPDIVATNATICEAESIDLATLVTDLDGGTASYYDSESEASARSANTISSTVSPNATDTYYVVSYNATTGCFSYEPIVITVVPCSEINILKTTNQSTTYTDVWTFELYNGPNGFGSSPIASETTAAGTTLFDGVILSSYNTYTVCELNVPAGWSTTWEIGGNIVIPYNPNQFDNPPEDFGNRCIEIGAGTSYPLPTATYGVNDPQTLSISVDNSFPGGEARTPGYWKNWNTCSGGGQAETAANNGGRAAGYVILDDILNDPGVEWCNITFSTCEDAVSILDQRDIVSGKKRASDPAYTLAMHALAAELNFGAGASQCQQARDALMQARTLLCDIGFDGTGDSGLKTKGKNKNNNSDLASYALELAAILDAYNNNELCDTNGNTQTELITDDSFDELTEPYIIRTYPNPFKDFVTIEFSVEKTSRTTVTLFDMSGRELDILFDQDAVAGHVYELEFNGTLYGDQMFIYRIESDNGLRTGKIVKSE
ncbi:T9SS type A sorting domain-containing protein [Mangrovivirga cuniculi]|uniref:Ig-like domain-containing protein n=1 Tax=Mangrovivirga cuniculi TaxID=2715131 RepID=A0A4D7JTS1_9BACT|nr:T9SS type A sorting domain-containing protein [Mangrovivirga cuniculi]QCK15546.1 hypothetical protein DCC35_12710 [Mangrovivirga cuniculi]